MTKKKVRKKKEPEAEGGVALSTLGEKLKSSNPELAEHFEAIKSMELSVPRLVQVVEDLLPYPWEDPARKDFITKRLPYFAMFCGSVPMLIQPTI